MSQEKVDRIREFFNIGNRSLNGGRYTEAINSYLSALSGVRDADIINSGTDFGGSFGIVGPREYEGMVLHSIGVAYKNLGDIAKASSYMKEAVSVFEAVGEPAKAERVKRDIEKLVC